MVMVQRFERNDKLVKVEDPRFDSYGNLRVNAVIARIGVQIYYDQEGNEIKEFRPPDEVQNSVASLSDLPITVDHPEKPVTPQNYKEFGKGHTSPCRYDEGLIKTRLNIMEQDAVKVALSTHRQLSVGYTCILDWTPGVWVDEFGVMGEKGKSYEYDCIQRDIKGNHVALVPLARAGNVATITDSVIKTPSKEIINMVKFVHDNRVFEVEGTDAEALVSLVSDMAKEEKAYSTKLSEKEASEKKKEEELDSMKKKCDELQAMVDGLKSKLDAAEVKTDANAIASEVKARLELINEVKDSLVEIDYSLDSVGIKKAYLSKVAPESVKAVLDSASVDYVNGLFAVLRPSENKQDSTVELKETLEKNDSAPNVSAFEKARQDAIARRSSYYLEY